MDDSAEDGIKQAIIIRTDLEMGRGKMVAQGSHASLMSFFEAEKADKSLVSAWIMGGEKKIVLKVADEEALLKLYKAFQYKGIPCALVSDAGLTELQPGTKTALGVGPWHAAEINQFTGKLKLL
jgi:PTH2 family peptidyl-tRNA hydrolase